uniref:Zinc finger and BTB domain containing 38 n=1 Tax=Monopterus albus TaxID=43700 RepID=A0A3Q3Q5B9_MONAL
MTVVSPCTQNLMDSAHPHTVLSKLNEQRSQGLFCDVTIVVEDVKFQAHKNILAACSGYFRNALTTPETWSSGQVLELMDLKSEVFASILNFIYCSKVTLSGAEGMGGLAAAGKRLGIPFLEKLVDQESQDECAKSTDSSTAPVPKKAKKEAPRPEETDNARGPRITNAFSITEVCPGNNPFTPLVQTSILGKSILPTPAEPQTNISNTITPTLPDAVAAAPAAVMTPPPLFSEAETEKTLLTIHSEVHKKRFVSHLFCKFCHKKFIHLKRLRNHEQVCPKVVISPPKLDATGISAKDPLQVDQSEYNCSVCKRVYVTLSSLKRHENVHSWQRAYPCHYCNKVFALAEYRTKHEIWHTGERRYQCIFCLETFMTYYILKNHQKSFHGIDPSLAAKKKSANGGLKASVYPIKLYRLLPMNCLLSDLHLEALINNGLTLNAVIVYHLPQR